MVGGIARLAARAVFIGLGLILLGVPLGSMASAAADATADPSPTAEAPWTIDDGTAPSNADDGKAWDAAAQVGPTSAPEPEVAVAVAGDRDAGDSWTAGDAGMASEESAAVTERQAPQAVDDGKTGIAPAVADGGGQAPSDGTDPAFVAAPQVETVAAPRASAQSVAFELTEDGGSGVSGTATLSATDGGTSIVLAVDGTDAATFAGLFYGVCGSLGPEPLILLGPVDSSGALVAEAPGTPLDSLRGRYAIAIYTLAGDEYAILACGDVPAATGGTAETNEAPASDAAPTVTSETGGITSTGVGTAAASAHGGTPLVAMLLAAAALVVGGVVARRRAPSR